MSVSTDRSRPASELFHQNLSPITEAPHAGETNAMVRAQGRLHGHPAFQKLLCSPHTHTHAHSHSHTHQFISLIKLKYLK